MLPNEMRRELSYSKNITVTSKYVILYKGASVSIYDQDFVCIKKIAKLKYVYDGYVSPDEKNLLLVSTKNHFHILSLEDFALTGPFSIKRPYNDNLEGIACWCSSDAFLLPFQNRETMLSKLVKVNCDLSLPFEDVIPEKFWIRYISYVDPIKRHLLLGLDRCEGSWNIIWLDKDNTYTICKVLDFDEAVFDFEMLCDTECIILTGETRVHCCDFYGRPSKIQQAYKMDFSLISGFPEFFKPSKKNSDIAFVGTTDALMIYNSNEQSVVKSYPIEYGARDVVEFKDSLFVCTFGGIKEMSLN